MKKTRKPVNRVSASRKIQNAEYAKLKRQWRKDPKNLVCCVENCMAAAEKDPHHSRGRIKSLLCMVEFWKPVCFNHHRAIHDQPAWARANGLLAPIGQWNNPQP